MADQKPVVGIIMGSKSDLGVMEGCTAELEALGVCLLYTSDAADEL